MKSQADAHQVGEVDEDAGPYQLTNLDREMLELERLWFKYTGARESVVRERFDMSLTRYSRRLSWLIEQPAAESYDAVLVHRLLRVRDGRRRQRSARHAH